LKKILLLLIVMLITVSSVATVSFAESNSETKEEGVEKDTLNVNNQKANKVQKAIQKEYRKKAIQEQKVKYKAHWEELQAMNKQSIAKKKALKEELKNFRKKLNETYDTEKTPKDIVSKAEEIRKIQEGISSVKQMNVQIKQRHKSIKELFKGNDVVLIEQDLNAYTELLEKELVERDKLLNELIEKAKEINKF
jgi:hypothetical protein